MIFIHPNIWWKKKIFTQTFPEHKAAIQGLEALGGAEAAGLDRGASVRRRVMNTNAVGELEDKHSYII